eukprot:362289-Chlamydomonas_euryale.AAC.7
MLPAPPGRRDGSTCRCRWLQTLGRCYRLPTPHTLAPFCCRLLMPCTPPTPHSGRRDGSARDADGGGHAPRVRRGGGATWHPTGCAAEHRRRPGSDAGATRRDDGRGGAPALACVVARVHVCACGKVWEGVGSCMCVCVPAFAMCVRKIYSAPTLTCLYTSCFLLP